MDEAELVSRRFGIEVRSAVVIEAGWDSRVLDVNGEWIFRFPRRAQVEDWLRKEIGLLPELAPALPVAVPSFELVSDDPIFVGYRKVTGRPLARDASPDVARDLARFLSALHAFPVERARAAGVAGDRGAWAADYARQLGRFRANVFPLLTADERAVASELFDEFLDRLRRATFETVLVHADLGPEHVLCEDGRVTGVIDWGDARIGDPALDFAWVLHGVWERFSQALLGGYDARIGDDFRERALFYHRLGPWYEVDYGLVIGQQEFVASGLEAVRARLP